MKAIDTNMLVRVFVDDDVAQCERARALVIAARASGSPLFVADLALAEFTWVLRARYRRPREEIVAIVGVILASPDLAFGDRERLARAHARWRRGHGDFADYLIDEQARAAGCDATLTFDGELLREEGFSTP